MILSGNAVASFVKTETTSARRRVSAAYDSFLIVNKTIKIQVTVKSGEKIVKWIKSKNIFATLDIFGGLKYFNVLKMELQMSGKHSSFDF
jgi:hypothetical protein